MNSRANNADNADEPRSGELMRPTDSLAEQTLAVDLARADFDQAIATAHRYPRILDVVLKKVETMACYNDAAAENSIYSLPRGGKPIIGPSIGFANILAQAWGNCIDGARITYIDRKEKVVVAEGGFHDLETNRKTVLPVQRRISGRDGRIFNDDMIMVTGMAAASIARRNAILNAVPRALWHPIYEQALLIVRGTVETFAELKDRAMKGFAQFGVAPEKIYLVLNVKGDADLTLEHIPNLRGMYSALRDGSVTVEEMFDPRRMTGTTAGRVANPLGEDDDEVHDHTTGEVLQQQGGQQPPAAQQTGAEAPKGDQVAAVTPAKAKRDRTKKTTAPADATPAAGTVPATEVKQPAAAAVAPALPKSAAEYEVHCLAWIASGSSASAIDDQWRAERDLRGACSVVEDVFDKLKKAKDARVLALKAA